MKQLRSSSEDLRTMFDHVVTVHHIAEPLASFDSKACGPRVREFMDCKEFDQIGVRRDGHVYAYALKSDLSDDTLGSCAKPIPEEQSIEDSEGLSKAFQLLDTWSAVYVRSFGRISGIVTHGDLQKAPVRMWLFGLITLIEMQMLRLVKTRFPGEEWKKLLKCGPLRAAERLQKNLEEDNRHRDLADCLQLRDKGTLLFENSDVWREGGFECQRSAMDWLEQLVRLRNDFAHANDFVKWRHDTLHTLVEKAQGLLEALEALRA